MASIRAARRRRLALSWAVVACAVDGVACGQDLVWEWIAAPEHRLGMPLSRAGDWDGDGYDEILSMNHVAAWIYGVDTQVSLISGRDGRVLKNWLEPPVQSRQYGNVAGVGDIDGDGIPDYALQILDVSHLRLPKLVEIHSGRDDSLIWVVSAPWETFFGTSIIGDLDLDGDRRPDVVVAAITERDPVTQLWIGGVYAYSNSGKLLHSFRGNTNGLHVGLSLARLEGDLDGDGLEDYIVGTNGYAPNGYGQAMVVSGASGKPIVHGIDTTIMDNIGEAVTGVGDVDGDGAPDFAAAGGFGGFAARVFSGRTGKMLFRAIEMGDVYSATSADFDQDGVRDLLVGAPDSVRPGEKVGAAIAYSLRDGTQLFRLAADPRTWGGSQTSSEFARHVVALPVVPGDPVPRFALSQPDYWPSGGGLNTGRIALHRGVPAGVSAFGDPCVAGAPRPPRIGWRDLGSAGVRIHLSEAVPGASALLCLGVSRTSFGPLSLPLSLTGFGFSGCRLFTSIDAIAVTSAGTVGLAAGYAELDLPLPLVMPGTHEVFGQWLWLSGGGFGWSGAVGWRR